MVVSSLPLSLSHDARGGRSSSDKERCSAANCAHKNTGTKKEFERTVLSKSASAGVELGVLHEVGCRWCLFPMI